MKFEVEPLHIDTRDPFTIARGTRTGYDIFIVSLTVDGITGIGEIAPQPFYHETPMTVRTAIGSIGAHLHGDPETMRRDIHDRSTVLGGLLHEHAAVRAGLDMALWDLRGRGEGRPVWDLVGADPSRTPFTSYTIGFDTPDAIDRKVDAAGEYRVLKVKMGVPGDLAILDRVIERSGKIIRVDANQGWDLDAALDRSRALFHRGVEFCEQPMPRENEDDFETLRSLSPLPILLDESVIGPGDPTRRRRQGHGINIKLMKCGGITPALAMIEEARSLGLSIMIGCMIETSVGVTAAAHLSPLVDYADLDGNLLLAHDPFVGVTVRDGRLVLPGVPGLGVTRRAQ